MNRKEAEDAIERKLVERKKRVVNRNALDALFHALPNPIGSLGKIFLGRKDALEAEKLRIQQDIILDLLCRIEDASSSTKDKAFLSMLTRLGDTVPNRIANDCLMDNAVGIGS